MSRRATFTIRACSLLAWRSHLGQLIWFQCDACPRTHTWINPRSFAFLLRRFYRFSRNDRPCWKSACFRSGVMLQLLSTPLQSGIGFLQHPLPAIPTTHLAVCLPRRGGMSGLPCFAYAAPNDLAPASTPTVVSSVCPHGVGGQPAACLLAEACQRLWLLSVDDACGSSLMLGVSSSLALQPP